MTKGYKFGWSFDERIEFYSIPEPNSGCLLWLGATDRRGYPKLWQKPKFRVVSHLILERAGRPVPKGRCACHSCDNPYCIEETHLFVGTQRDNIHDMMKKGRQNMTAPGKLIAARTHCAKGHEYPQNPRRLPNGRRICEPCLKAKVLRRSEKLARLRRVPDLQETREIV